MTEITLPFIGASYEDEEISWFGYIFGAGSYEANGIYVPERLKTVTITEGLTFLGYGSFAYCTGLETINGPHSVSRLGYNVFLNTTAYYCLTNIIQIEGSIGWYELGTGLSGHLTLAEGLDSLVIADCHGLTGLALPEGVTYVNIVDSGIEEIYIPESVTTFIHYGRTKLRTVRLSAEMTDLDEEMFAGCKYVEF